MNWIWSPITVSRENLCREDTADAGGAMTNAGIGIRVGPGPGGATASGPGGAAGSGPGPGGAAGSDPDRAGPAGRPRAEPRARRYRGDGCQDTGVASLPALPNRAGAGHRGGVVCDREGVVACGGAGSNREGAWPGRDGTRPRCEGTGTATATGPWIAALTASCGRARRTGSPPGVPTHAPVSPSRCAPSRPVPAANCGWGPSRGAEAPHGALGRTRHRAGPSWGSFTEQVAEIGPRFSLWRINLALRLLLREVVVACVGDVQTDCCSYPIKISGSLWQHKGMSSVADVRVRWMVTSLLWNGKVHGGSVWNRNSQSWAQAWSGANGKFMSWKLNITC